MCRSSEIVSDGSSDTTEQASFSVVGMQLSFFSIGKRTDLSTGNGVGVGIHQTHVCRVMLYLLT